MHTLALFLMIACPATADDRETYTNQEGNYRLTYPKTWRSVKAPYEDVQLALLRGRELIMVFGLETRATVEDLIEDISVSQKMTADTVKELSRRETTIAGERAMAIHSEGRITGIKFHFSIIVFTHQGIAYRVVGLSPNREMADDADFVSIIKSFGFLGDRKDWLAKYEGKPARTALLGGLASLELNRPRWTETFGSRPDYSALDGADFEHIAGGAWLSIQAVESHNDAPTELDAHRQEQMARLKKPEVTAHTHRTKTGEIPFLMISGTHENQHHIIRAAVIVKENIALRVALDCSGSKREAVRGDWEQLLNGITLYAPSLAPEAPAFSLKRDREHTLPDAALAVFLSKATRVLPGSRVYEVAGISPDGTLAVIRSQTGFVVENLRTGKRDPVDLGGGNNAPVGFSPDGKRLVIASEAGITVASIGAEKAVTVQVKGFSATFTPTEGEVLACTGENSLEYPPQRFRTQKLERVRMKDGHRVAIVDFPLCRVQHPAVSPDGKHLALACNRDYPRTASQGGHLYVCGIDGSNMRQLTKDPEEITSLSWAPDGQSLFVVRRVAVGDHGAVGAGASGDLYRVSLDSGEIVNLTRSGRIGRVWTTGGDLLIEVNAWNAPESQRGIFRISVDDLSKATASRPLPPPSNPRRHAAEVAQKITAAIAPVTLYDLVLTPQVLEKVATTFADAVGNTCGVKLDFTTASLDRLSDLVTELDLGSGRERSVLLGFGAYYGETLRRVARAEWKLQSLPFGRWLPGQNIEHALIDVVLPFSEPFRVAHQSEMDSIRTSQTLANHPHGQTIVLVYPPTYAREAAREAAGKDYNRAMDLLDRGEAKPALDTLVQEMNRHPRNAILARDIIAICEAAGLSQMADDLSRRAAEAGNEVPDVLLRHADQLAKTDPKKALEYYRRAALSDWPAANVLIRVGTAYSDAGNQPVAESCWRRAYWRGTEPQRAEIRKLIGVPDPNPQPSLSSGVPQSE